MEQLSHIVTICILMFIGGCSQRESAKADEATQVVNAEERKQAEAAVEETRPVEIVIEKEYLYDKYTLEDSYPYKDTTRQFQWEKIKAGLTLLSQVQRKPVAWGVLQNRGNSKGEAPVARNIKRNEYGRVVDAYGVEKHQSIPLYLPDDASKPERYGRDGTLVRLLSEINDSTKFVKVSAVYFEGEWTVPVKYINAMDTTILKKVIFVDRTNQNIATLENAEDDKWLVRSMNKATTGAHRPPYQHETPLGIFVVQEKKERMQYLIDGTQEIAGFAPYASRFCQGGYIHGVPVNKPRTALIETSATLGTTPRSHMCVRNATSHAKFVFDWAPVGEALVYVIE